MPSNPPNPLPCGCRVMGTPDLDCFHAIVRYKDLHVEFCPLHAAAANLLGRLQLILELAEADGDAQSRLRAIAKVAKVLNPAILKARPAKEKKAQTEENRAV